ncbi:hypothetical protein [Rhodovulum marinum]|uniref:Translocase n=1 Tax=Rhodovulum marinum TaxID=320662 RepID=A0A4V2SQX0_9RHOB|nr:hypothetical protein [Rhodovulum marinum]TCP40236.1 hypothetical protein EV662_108111 [Rhodovulum marinum]
MKKRKQRLLAIGLSVATVVASGQYMERSQPHHQAEMAEIALADITLLAARGPVAPASGGVSAIPALPDDPATPEGLHPGPVRLVATPAQRPADGPAIRGLKMPALGVSGLPCGPEMTAEATDEATVRLILSAPCRPGRRVTLHHDLISFTEVTDQLGLLSVEVPVMVPAAAFVAEFDDGATVAHALSLPAAAGRRHAALVTVGAGGMQLHAYEAGARFGGAGHVWAAAPQGIGARGTLRVLGDPGLPGGRIAQVYTAPAGAQDLRLSVEAQVTPANCGREIEAQTVLPDRAGSMTSGVVSFVLPGCDAVGEFLVLKNLPQDRKLATN